MANANILELSTYTLKLQAARWMTVAHPDWWPGEQDALDQMTGCVGWLKLDQPGWLLARPYPAYRAVEIETVGSETGVGPGLEGLVAACEGWTYGQPNGYTHIRWVISSRGLSVDGPLKSPAWVALRDLHPIDRPEFDWWQSLGFAPFGLFPNAYAPGRHGVLMVKILMVQ